MLGDFAHAQSWRTYAYVVERAQPGSLQADERAFLDRVWIALEARFRGLPAATANTAVATQTPAQPNTNPVLAPAPTPAAEPAQRSLVAPPQ